MPSTAASVLTALLVGVATLSAVPAWASRPLDTDDTGTAPAGSAEMELGVEHTRDDDDLLWAARAVIAVGMRDTLELRLESTLAGVDGLHEAGIGDAGSAEWAAREGWTLVAELVSPDLVTTLGLTLKF